MSGKLSAWSGLTYPELVEVIQPDDISDADLRRMTEESYGANGADVAPLGGSLHVLELFHGTPAFKDFALQFLGELFSHIRWSEDRP